MRPRLDHIEVRRVFGALAKPFYLLAFLLVVKLLVLRSVVFGSFDVPRFLVTDLPIALLIAAAFEGRRQGRRSTVIIVDAAITTVLAGLLVFHAYYGRLPSLQALGFAEQLGGVKTSVFALIRPEFLLFYVDLLPLAILAFARPAFFDRRVAPRVRGSFVMVAAAVATIEIGIAIVHPSPDFTIAAETRGIANQTIADWITREFIGESADKDRLGAAALGAAAEASEEASSPIAGIAKGRNVIVILAESLQAVTFGRSVGGQEIIPTINALGKEGYAFDNIFSQVAAGNTSDAEFALNTSLMPLENRPFALDYGERAVPSLPKLLKAQGYTTMTFHPNKVTFWYRDKLYPALGFDQIYDEKFYGREDVIGIGSSDDVIYQKALPVLEKTAKEGKPFYAAFVSISSHHPFELPADRKTLKLPAEMSGTLTGRYLQSQHYSDAALGRFIEGLKKAGLYEKSVIVVVGDHFGLQPNAMNATDVDVASTVAGHPYGDVDRFRVPLVVAIPGAKKSEVVHKVGGQVDVLPTLAPALGLSLDGFVHIGRDLLVPGPSLVAIRYYAPSGTYVDDKMLAIRRGENGVEALSLTTGARLPSAGDGAEEKTQKVLQMTQLSDSYVRSLPSR